MSDLSSRAREWCETFVSATQLEWRVKTLTTLLTEIATAARKEEREAVKDLMERCKNALLSPCWATLNWGEGSPWEGLLTALETAIRDREPQ